VSCHVAKNQAKADFTPEEFRGGALAQTQKEPPRLKSSKLPWPVFAKEALPRRA